VFDKARYIISVLIFSRHFQIMVSSTTIIKAHIVLFFWHYVMPIIILHVLVLECLAGVVMGLEVKLEYKIEQTVFLQLVFARILQIRPKLLAVSLQSLSRFQISL